MKFIITKIFFLSVVVQALAQPSPSDLDKTYDLLRKHFDEKQAYKTVEFVEQRWRLAGNKGFDESIYYVEEILKSAGFSKEKASEQEAVLTYRIEKRAMKNPTWEAVSASIQLGNESLPLLSFASNRNMLAINSASTSIGGITAEVIYVGTGKGDFEGKDVRGAIVFGETNVGSLYKTAIDKGAIGVFAYSLPDYVQPTKHVNSIQFQRIPLAKSGDQKFGVLLSYAAKQKLKSALEKGPVTATVKIETKIYPSEELTLVANVRGKTKPDERFVFSAHVQEPGANDNASGVGTLAEMARVTAKLVNDNKFAPDRTITFLWGDEIVSTHRYITDDASRAKGIKWGLSLDMVGEDVDKTGGSFLIEKMPDPSAIWTRGKEKHTEWGGSVLKESQMFPHYFNDFILNRCNQQAKESGWTVNSNPFEGGSDHTPFLEAKIPGVLMWHFTDVFYHTDNDRLINVSPKEMRNVGISALASAFSLCSANEESAIFFIDEIKTNALTRLTTEFDLSKTAIKNGASVNEEKHILEVWASYYVSALEKMTEILMQPASAKVISKIISAQSDLKDECSKLISQLPK
jgi:aminopeptidase YwaD